MADSPRPSAAPAASDPIPEDLRQRLVGRWQRLDGDYVLTIQSIASDGRVTAAYSNPGPINVGSAVARKTAGELSLRVELRDRGYPGSYYTLTYDVGRDMLVGVYHHLGINENFDVVFQRRK